jgi:hypothetical protein
MRRRFMNERVGLCLLLILPLATVAVENSLTDGGA